MGVLCPEQGYWPVARPRSVGGLFRTFGRHVRGTCSQTLRRRVVQPHIQEGLRLGARASGAFRETVRLRTSAWRSGVGERQVIGLNADVCHQASVRPCTCRNGMAGPTRVIIWLAAVLSHGNQKIPKRDTLPPCLWHHHHGGPDADEHHGFLKRLWEEREREGRERERERQAGKAREEGPRAQPRPLLDRYADPDFRRRPDLAQ